ncbi:Gtpase activating protein [Globisporangium polare]
MWEKVAQELRLSTEKMGLVQLTGRAVSDRFQLLLKLHRSGTLKVKSPPAIAAELHQVINSLLRDISNHIDDIRASRGKPAKQYGPASSADAMRLHAGPQMATSATEVQVVGDKDDDEKGEEEDGDEAAEGMALLNRLRAKGPSLLLRVDDDAVAAEDAVATVAHHDQDEHQQQQQQVQMQMQVSLGPPHEHQCSNQQQQQQQQLLTAQLVAIETEKLRLKKRKLALLAQHHEEHMELLRQRLLMEERRFQEESAARRHEWQLLLERLSQGPSGGGGPAPAAPATTTTSSSDVASSSSGAPMI